MRTEGGAIFEVDPSMPDALPVDPGYRQSSAAPSVSAIVPAPPVPGVRWAPAVLAIGLGLLVIVLTLALLR